jgi:hypothetical protein
MSLEVIEILNAVMGEITSLTKNTKEFASLKTTVPMSFVRQWGLTDKDKLYWEWKVVDGEMIAVVAKNEPNTFTPGLKKEKKSRRISAEEKPETGGKKRK